MAGKLGCGAGNRSTSAMPSEGCRRVRALLVSLWSLVTIFCLGSCVSELQALQLTGVLLESVDDHGNPAGPVWHTASGYGGRPLGFTRWPPPQTRGIPFPLAPDGSLSIELWPGPFVPAHVTHLFWQFLPGEFPSALVLNLYFNGDNVMPGISAWVPWRYGFTHLLPNPAPTTRSLYLDVVDHPSSLTFDDGQFAARLTAAFFFPSHGEPRQWRPRDFTDIDRVGIDALRPDGQPDGVLIFELKVEASSFASPSSRWRPPWRAPALGGPPAVSSSLPEEGTATVAPSSALPLSPQRGEGPSPLVSSPTVAVAATVEESSPTAPESPQPSAVAMESVTPALSPQASPPQGKPTPPRETPSPQSSLTPARTPTLASATLTPRATPLLPGRSPRSTRPQSEAAPSWWQRIFRWLSETQWLADPAMRARPVSKVLEAPHDGETR